MTMDEAIAECRQRFGFIVMGSLTPLQIGKELLHGSDDGVLVPVRVTGPATAEEWWKQANAVADLRGTERWEPKNGLDYKYVYRVEALD